MRSFDIPDLIPGHPTIPSGFFLYKGPSMNPTFRHLDMLHVVPYECHDARIGDVVVYLKPDDLKRTTHRIVSINENSIRTRGDNNSNMDPYILNADHIIGRIDFLIRNSRRISVSRGILGHIHALKVSASRKAADIASMCLHPVYIFLSRLQLFRFIPFLPDVRVLSFNKRDGMERQLVMGKKVIGRCMPGSDTWHISRPFRLLVNEKKLKNAIE